MRVRQFSRGFASIFKKRDPASYQGQSLLRAREQLGFSEAQKDLWFRELSGKEWEAVTVLDNRSLLDSEKAAMNSVLVVCDHASNDLKSVKPEKNEEHFCQTSDAFDKGAAEFAIALTERLECLGVFANFSKLLIDVSQPILSSDLVPSLYLSSLENKRLLEL